jgi:DNA polymerase III epsilon subunit-like protein
VCDLETTHKEPSKAEIISGYFMYLDSSLNVIDQYEFKCQPELWDKNAEDASQIHGITYYEAMGFEKKYEAYSGLCHWLSRLGSGHFVAHGNRRIFGKFYTFDYAALVCNLLDAGYYFEFTAKFMSKDIISTHSLAKSLNIASKYDLKSLAQYFNLGEFDHHDAKSDCVICYELLKKMMPQVDLKEFLEQEYYNTREISNDSKPRKTKTKRLKI